MPPCQNSWARIVIDSGRLVVIGAGGHAKVVIDTAERSGWTVVGVIDDHSGASVFGYPYLGSLSDAIFDSAWQFVIAIGSNAVRAKIAAALDGRVNWATVVDFGANVSKRATVGVGGVVFAGSVIQADAIVGRHCIVNSAASIDHDVFIGDCCHVAPRAVLTGGVRLEEGVFVGAGAVMTPLTVAGAWSTLGAGAVAVQNLEPGAVYVGVPARKIQ